MIYKVVKDHKCDNTKPIIVTKGTKVKVGEQSDSNGIWPNWIYCYSLDGQGEGWTPIQIIQIENNYGIVLEDYSAVELEVIQGAIVEGNIELNGWLWCKKINEIDTGWLPKEKLVPLK